MRNDNAFECHRSALGLFSRLLLVLVPLSLVYAFLYTVLSKEYGPPSQALQNITIVYRLICLALILEMVRLYFNDLYVFGHSRVIQFKGRLSFKYGRVAIAFKDIRDIGIKQSLLGRLLGYGTVTFGTASKDDYEITMVDLPQPEKLSSFVQEHIEKILKEKQFAQLSETTGSLAHSA